MLAMRRLRFTAGNAPAGGSLGAHHPARPLFLIYCLVIVYTTLLPFQFTLERVQAPHRYSSALTTLPPLFLWDLVGNVILFVPVGFLALLGQPRRNRRTPGALARAGYRGLLLSVAVELGQWFTPSRDPALSDILSNTLGALLGAGFAAVLATRHSATRSSRHVLDLLRREPALFQALALLLLAGIWALVPFDVSLQPQALARSLRTMRLNPMGDPATRVDLTSVLLYAAFAATATRALHALWPARRNRSGWMLLAFVGVWALLLEALQLALKSRDSASLDVIVALGGGGVGRLVGAWIEAATTEGTRRARAALAYGAGLVMLALRPPGTACGVELVQHRLAVLIPGYLAHFDATLAGVTEFVHGVLLFAPLGHLLAAFMGTRESLSWTRGGLLLLLALASAAVTMSFVTMLGGDSPFSLAGALPACMGGVLGASVRAWHLETGAAAGISAQPQG